MNPQNWCDDCARKNGLSVAGAQCYTRCGGCGITRSCFGPAPAPPRDARHALRDDDQHLQRVKRERAEAIESKAARFAARWTRDDLWRVDPTLCTDFDDQQSRYEAARASGVAHDIDVQGLDLERAYGIVLAEMTWLANKAALAGLLEGVRSRIRSRFQDEGQLA